MKTTVTNKSIVSSDSFCEVIFQNDLKKIFKLLKTIKITEEELFSIITQLSKDFLPNIKLKQPFTKEKKEVIKKKVQFITLKLMALGCYFFPEENEYFSLYYILSFIIEQYSKIEQSTIGFRDKLFCSLIQSFLRNNSNLIIKYPFEYSLIFIELIQNDHQYFFNIIENWIESSLSDKKQYTFFLNIYMIISRISLYFKSNQSRIAKFPVSNQKADQVEFCPANLSENLFDNYDFKDCSFRNSFLKVFKFLNNEKTIEEISKIIESYRSDLAIYFQKNPNIFDEYNIIQKEKQEESLNEFDFELMSFLISFRDIVSYHHPDFIFNFIENFDYLQENIVKKCFNCDTISIEDSIDFLSDLLIILNSPFKYCSGRFDRFVLYLMEELCFGENGSVSSKKYDILKIFVEKIYFLIIAVIEEDAFSKSEIKEKIFKELIRFFLKIMRFYEGYVNFFEEQNIIVYPYNIFSEDLQNKLGTFFIEAKSPSEEFNYVCFSNYLTIYLKVIIAETIHVKEQIDFYEKKDPIYESQAKEIETKPLFSYLYGLSEIIENLSSDKRFWSHEMIIEKLENFYNSTFFENVQKIACSKKDGNTIFDQTELNKSWEIIQRVFENEKLFSLKCTKTKSLVLSLYSNE